MTLRRCSINKNSIKEIMILYRRVYFFLSFYRPPRPIRRLACPRNRRFIERHVN